MITAEPHTRAFAVTTPGDVGAARRGAVELAAELGFDATAQGRIAIVASEAATNLAAHGGGGQLLASPLRCDGVAGIDLIALDRGRGMEDLARCLRDGYSTAGTAGQGLGAVQRQSQVFEVHSLPGRGTVLFARLLAGPLPPAGAPLRTAALSLPCPGETVCGDAVAQRQHDGQAQFLVVDGLGHGPAALDAASEAVRAFIASAAREPLALMRDLHDALRKTRGAAAAICRIDRSAGIATVCGVGNINACLIDGSGTLRSMVSHNGILGHQAHKLQEFTYPFPADGILVMHSDGITNHWRLDTQPGLLRRHPGVIAGSILRDHRRGRDDASVLVARR